MKRSNTFTLALTALALCCNISAGQTPQASPRAVMPEKHIAVFKQYCFDCHDAESREGKLNLEELSFEVSRDIPTAEWWSKILAALNAGEMPPMDAEQISNAEKAALLEDLSQQMVTARQILSDSGGVITIRRLNRREYQNTLEALLGFRPDVSTLPADDGTGGFDTAGASLFFSSDQFEQYRATATRALTSVLTPHEKPESKTMRLEGEVEVSEGFFAQAKQTRDNHERSKAYLAQNAKPPTDFGFRDRQQAVKQNNRFKTNYPPLGDYIARSEAKTGAVLSHSKNRTPSIATPKIRGANGGKYILRVRAGYYDGTPERERYLEYRFVTGKQGSTVLGYAKVTGTLDEPSIIEVPVNHPLGEFGGFSIGQRDYKEKVSKRYINEVWRKKNGIGQPPSLWIDYVEMEGPIFDTWPNPVQLELLPPRETAEAEASYARRIITNFATRAFRGRKPSETYLNKLVERYLSKSSEKENSVEAAVDVFALILSSPDFLYMSEPRQGEKPERLDGRELAIRLSYFLWSSPPDNELLALAKSGRLSDPATLRAQTDRLLGDSRAEAFVSGFAHQWLNMARLDMFEFQAEHHPEFDEAIRTSARQEVYASIQHLIDEQLPLETLLKADFVVVDDVLADYYGIPNVSGSEFRKVAVPADSVRGGLLGAAATHIMGSDGQRSSPVERGAWVLRYLLNDPPPPPPANVPMLSRLDDKVLAVRELQKAHQEAPQCAQCHRKIDPIGYGLENFTAAGLWRDHEIVVKMPSVDTETKKKKQIQPVVHTFPIDPSGTLPRGERFANYLELRDAVTGYRAEFARGFAEHLIAYALGRPYGISDHNLATAMTEDAATHNDTISAFVHALVQSKPFQRK